MEALMSRCLLRSTTLILIAATAPLAAGCSAMASFGLGGHTGTSSPSSAMPEPHGHEASDQASDSTGGPLSAAELTAKLVPALEGDARFSAAQAHGKPSLCPDSAGKTVLGVWSVESGADPFTKRPGFEVNCFALSHPLYTALKSMRDAQDAGVLTQVSEEWFAPEKGATIAFQYDDGAFWALQGGKTVKLLRMPIKADASKTEDRSSGELFAAYSTLVDRRAIAFDELTTDAASATSIDLDADRAAFIAAAEKALSARNKEWAASDDAELAAVTLPKQGLPSNALVKAAREWLEHNAGETGIDPKQIKKVYISDNDWSIRHDDEIHALIVGKVISATVTFKKDTGKCYFMSFNLQRDYAGNGTYNSNVYGNGFQSEHTEIRCSKI
jgi:hypothetical protein